MQISRYLIIALLSFFSCEAYAQKPVKVIVAHEDPHNLYNFESTDTSDLFYMKIEPSIKPIACLVILPSSGELVEDVMKQITLHKLAVNKGLLVIFPSLNWGSIQFDEEQLFLDTIFRQVVQQYKIPKDKFILGGLSGGGMISLTYAEIAHKKESTTYLVPKAIFALDPPLDLSHLYKHAKRDVEKNVVPAAVNEGHWLMNTMNAELGGSPDEAPAAYIKYSIFSYSEKDGGNAKYLLNTPVRIYTEPAIEWQIKNRHRDLYDLNCTDISAMINLLQLQGNDQAEIVVTHDKGVRLDGTRHPHSWSIMDSKECLQWILKQL